MSGRQQDGEWQEITDPDGRQKGIFEASKSIYHELFSPEHQEDWSHFREYILDTQQRLKGDPAADPQDCYYVANVGTHVRGIAFLTTYQRKRLAFMSYFGVLSPQASESRRLAFKGALRIMERVRGSIDGILFEVEKIATENLSRRDRWTRQRVAVLNSFQRAGARKISWLLYEQPKLELDAATPEATNLHLMFLSTSRVSKLSAASRDTVKDYLDFVYNTFYLDGFEVTDPDDVTKAKTYLGDLFHRVITSLPEDAEEIPFGEVNLKPWGITALISYTSGGLLLTTLLANYLEDMGIHVLYWDKDAPRHASRKLQPTLREWVEASDLVVGLITEQTLEAWGMIEELIWARDSGKRIVVLMSKDMPREQFSKLESKVNNLLGNIIYIPFEVKKYYLTLTTMADLVRTYYPR